MSRGTRDARPDAIDPTLAEIASDVAWGYTAYGYYRRDRATALRALRRRAPGFDRPACERALDAALRLVADCRAIVAAGPPVVDAAQAVDLGPYRRRLASHVRRLGPETVDAILRMVILYDQLM